MIKGPKSVKDLPRISPLNQHRRLTMPVRSHIPNSLVTNPELAALWNLFEGLQSRSSEKFGLDKDIFFKFIKLTVSKEFVNDSLGLMGTQTLPTDPRRLDSCGCSTVRIRGRNQAFDNI